MRGDGRLSSEGLEVEVTGLTSTLRALNRAGAEAEDMRALMHALGTLVVRAARPPVVSGRLASTVRAGRAKSKAVVRAGGARTPYAGVIHYGWPARNIRPQPFLTDALHKQRPNILRQVERGLDDVLRKSQLK